VRYLHNVAKCQKILLSQSAWVALMIYYSQVVLGENHAEKSRICPDRTQGNL